MRQYAGAGQGIGLGMPFRCVYYGVEHPGVQVWLDLNHGLDIMREQVILGAENVSSDYFATNYCNFHDFGRKYLLSYFGMKY